MQGTWICRACHWSRVQETRGCSCFSGAKRSLQAADSTYMVTTCKIFSCGQNGEGPSFFLFFLNRRGTGHTHTDRKGEDHSNRVINSRTRHAYLQLGVNSIRKTLCGQLQIYNIQDWRSKTQKLASGFATHTTQAVTCDFLYNDPHQDLHLEVQLRSSLFISAQARSLAHTTRTHESIQYSRHPRHREQYINMKRSCWKPLCCTMARKAWIFGTRVDSTAGNEIDTRT